MKSMSMKKLNIIMAIVHKKDPVSLRIIEYFVTKYAKEKNIGYRLNNIIFRPYESYKNDQIKAFNKELFDVYRRTKTFTIKTELGVLETTVAQLNFFQWLFKYKILDYVIEHQDVIKAHLEKPEKKKKASKKAHMCITNIDVVINFD